MNAYMYTPEERQKHVGQARTTSNQRQIRFLCITWLPAEAPGSPRQSACHACMNAQSQRWAHAGSSPSARATGYNYVISSA